MMKSVAPTTTPATLIIMCMIVPRANEMMRFT